MHQTQLNKAISQAQGATAVGLLPPPLLPLPPASPLPPSLLAALPPSPLLVPVPAGSVSDAWSVSPARPAGLLPP